MPELVVLLVSEEREDRQLVSTMPLILRGVRVVRSRPAVGLFRAARGVEGCSKIVQSDQAPSFVFLDLHR